MKTDSSIATFWHSYAAVEKTTKRLTEESAQIDLGSADDTAQADEMVDNAMQEVVEYRQRIGCRVRSGD